MASYVECIAVVDTVFACQECEENGEDFDRVKLMEIGAEQAERWDRMKKKKNPDPGFSGQSFHIHSVVLVESLEY